MTKKKSFLIYYDQQEVIDKLKDEEAGRIFKDLFRYGSQNIVPDYGDNRLMSVVFLVLKIAIDRDAEKYEATCKKNRENSKKRWKQENTSNEGVRADATAYEGNREKPVVTDLMQTNPKDADSDRDIDRDKEIDRDRDIMKAIAGKKSGITYKRAGNTRKNSFHNFDQRDYDYEKLEEALVEKQRQSLRECPH